METKGSRELRCVHRKTSFEEDTLGLVLRPTYFKDQFELKAIYTDLQYVSQTAFNQEGLSNNNREFLPLLLNEEHSKKAWRIIEQLFQKLGNWKSFHPYMILNYVPKLLNYTVISFVTQGNKEEQDANQQAEQTLLKYAHFHHMLLAFARRYPEITIRANKKLKEFKENAEKREKKHTPDLGEFLTYLALSNEVQWRDFAIPFLKEFLDRNTLFIVRKCPELANLNVRDTCFRLTQSLEVTSTARKILMFQLLFVHLMQPPTQLKGDERIAELVDGYNRRLGEPAPGVLDKLLKAAWRINHSDTWDTFFDNVRVNHLEPENLSNLLKECVTNSLKKKYHAKALRSDNHRDTTQCLCNNPTGCSYKVAGAPSAPAPKTSAAGASVQQKSKSIPSSSTPSSQPTKPVGNAWKNPLTIKPTVYNSTASPAAAPSSTSSAPATSTSPAQNNKNLWRPKSGKDTQKSPQPTTPIPNTTSFPSVSLGHTLGHTIVDPNTHQLIESVTIDHRLYNPHLEINAARQSGDHQHVDLNSLAADIAASHDLSPPITDLEHHNNPTSHSQVIKREKKLKRERDSGLSPFAKPFVPGLLWLTSDQQQPVYRSSHSRSRPDKSRLPNAEADPSLVQESLTPDNYLYRPLSAPSAAESSLLSLISPSLTDPSWNNSANLGGPIILSPPTTSKSFADHHQQQFHSQELYHPDPTNSFGVQVEEDSQGTRAQPSKPQPQQQQQRERQDSQKREQDSQKRERHDSQKRDRHDSQKRDRHDSQHRERHDSQKRERHDSQKGRQEKSDRKEEKHETEKHDRQENQEKGKRDSYRSRENSRTKEDSRLDRKGREEAKVDENKKGGRKPLTRLTPNPAAAAANRTRSKPTESVSNEKTALHEITAKLATTHAQTQGAKRARDPHNPWGFTRPIPQTETKPSNTEQKRASRERAPSGTKEEDVHKPAPKQDGKRKSWNTRKSSESEQPQKPESEQPRRATAPAQPVANVVSATAPRSKTNPWGNISVNKTSIASTFTEAQNENKNQGKAVAPANVYAKVAQSEGKAPAKRSLPTKPPGQQRNTPRRGDNLRRDNRDFPKRDNRDFPKRDNRDFPKKRVDPSNNRDFPKKPTQNRDFPKRDRDGPRDFPKRDRNYPRRDGGRYDRRDDSERRREPREGEDEDRPRSNYRRNYYQNRRRGSDDRGEDRRYNRRDSEDGEGYRRPIGRNYGYRRYEGHAENSDWRRPGGDDRENDRDNRDDRRDNPRGGSWEDDEERGRKRERADSERAEVRSIAKEEAAPVSNRYQTLQKKTAKKEAEEGSEEEADEQQVEVAQKRKQKNIAEKSTHQTNGVEGEEEEKESEKPERRFALPERAVKELRPVTDAKAVESNDVSAVRKQLNAWEQRQLKETAAQQRRAEQSQRYGSGGGGRRWGDMDRTDRRGGGRGDASRRGGDDRRDDRRGDRHDDRRDDRETRGGNDRRPLDKSEDLEIDGDLESSGRKKSAGSEKDDHSFDDEDAPSSTKA